MARAAAPVQRIVRPAEGVLSGLPGAVTDLAVSRDGRHLVAAHFGQDAVSVIDIATLAVVSTVCGIAEPYAVSTADRAYVRSASIVEDSVVAVDLTSGAQLAAREIGVGAQGLAVSPEGDRLYVARVTDDSAEIAVIDVESGTVSSIPVAHVAGAAIDTVRINKGGTRLYAAMTTTAGGALLMIDVRSGQVQTVQVGESIGDIAVDGNDRRVFTTGWDPEFGGVLRIVDTASARLVHTIAIGGLPVGLLVTGGAVYVADGDDLVVIEERRELIEHQVLSMLGRSGAGPRIWGKCSPAGEHFIPRSGTLTPDLLARVLHPMLAERLDGRLSAPPREKIPLIVAASSPRTPWYCSGCPHSASTAVPDGQPVGIGIGCHSITTYMPEERVGRSIGITQMGGEGAQWVGM